MSRDRTVFLIDANVIIHAHDYYYNMNRVPEFWDWIKFHADGGRIKMPLEIMEEIKGGKEAQHAVWTHSTDVKKLLMLDEEANEDLLFEVVDNGYGQELTDVEVEKIGQDPFLVAYALADPATRIVISNENSKPSAQRANRKIPDVCKQFGVECYNVYHLLRALDFSTNWYTRL